MSFSYNGDPASSAVDYIRFIVGDTVEAAAILQDEEIEWIISEYTTVNKQLAAAFRQMATSYSKVPKRKLGPQQEDGVERAKYYTERAEYFDKLSNMSAAPPLPDYSAEKIFDKGMMTNV